MSDTPETDAVEFDILDADNDVTHRLVEADFARRLERERDDLLAEVERLRALDDLAKRER